MFKWFFRIVALVVAGFFGLLVYDYYKVGLHTRPEMPDGAFSLSFRGGPRLIVQELDDESDSRTYVVRKSKITPPWYKKSWSYCNPPTDEEAKRIADTINAKPGLRLDAVCSLDADGEVIPTGILYSAPNL